MTKTLNTATTTDREPMFPTDIPTAAYYGRKTRQGWRVTTDHDDADLSPGDLVIVLARSHTAEVPARLVEVVSKSDDDRNVWSIRFDRDDITPEQRAENTARRAEARAAYARSPRGIETQRRIDARLSERLAAALVAEGMGADDAAAVVEQVQTAAEQTDEQTANTLAAGLADLLASLAPAPKNQNGSRQGKRGKARKPAPETVKGTCQVCNHPQARNLSPHPATTADIDACSRCLKLPGDVADKRAARHA